MLFNNKALWLFWVIMVLGVTFAEIWIVSPAQAQPGPPGMPGMPGNNRDRRQGDVDDKIAEAADLVQGVAQKILERVSKNVPLSSTDIQSIQNALAEKEGHFKRLDKPDRAYLMLIEAYVAHYSGKREEAIQAAQRAEQVAPEMVDISDSLITLALSYGDFNLAKTIMRKRGAGQAVQAATAESKVSSSEWAPSKKNPRSAQQPQPGMMPGRNTVGKGVLNLPVEHMPMEYLGNDFSALSLPTLNSTYFYYQPGQGQVLCAILWVAQTGDDKSDRGRTSMMVTSKSTKPPSPLGMPGMGMPGMTGAGMMGVMRTEQETQIPEVAFDLGTNMEQFKRIFTTGMMTGKVAVLGMNMNPPRDRALILQMLMENPWPWANCMISDAGEQWKIKEMTTPVMLIVDTKGKIRYMGPVGGYLPELILSLELPQAKASGGPVPMAPVAQKAGGSGGFFGKLVGQGDAGGGSGSAPSATPAKPVEKETNTQAAQMISAADLKARTGSRNGACQIYDDVIERYPNSVEADQARLRIKDICLGDPQIARNRQQNGKYTGQ